MAHSHTSDEGEEEACAGGEVKKDNRQGRNRRGGHQEEEKAVHGGLTPPNLRCAVWVTGPADYLLDPVRDYQVEEPYLCVEKAVVVAEGYAHCTSGEYVEVASYEEADTAEAFQGASYSRCSKHYSLN